MRVCMRVCTAIRLRGGDEGVGLLLRSITLERQRMGVSGREGGSAEYSVEGIDEQLTGGIGSARVIDLANLPLPYHQMLIFAIESQQPEKLRYGRLGRAYLQSALFIY
jgi:hypothetical protein